MLRLLNEGFMYSFLFGVLCYAFGLVPSIIIFGSGVTAIQVGLYCPLIGLVIIIFFIIVGFIVEFFGDLL